MITPEQAAGSDAQGEARARRSVALSTSVEARIDDALVRQGRAVISSRLVQGALLAAAEVVRELERRYRRAGWWTQVDGATLTIARPA